MPQGWASCTPMRFLLESDPVCSRRLASECRSQGGMLQGDTQLNGDNVGFLDGRGILDQRCFRISGQQG